LLVFDNWRKHWELPGGGRDEGESPRTAAVRELYEESGLRTDELIFVGVSSYESPPDGSHERVAVYRTTLAPDVPDPVPLFEVNDEIGGVRWWDPTEARDGVDPLDATIIDRVLADDHVQPSPLDITRSSYQIAAEKYVRRSRTTAGGSAPILDRMVELSPGSRLLELGSGPGWDAAYLERLGLVVQRSDVTPAFVELMRADGHDARILDARTDDLGGPWNGVLANAVLLHLSRSEFSAVVARVANAVRPGGLFAFTLKEGDGEAWTETKLDLPGWFVYWREPELRSVLEDAGWTVLWVERSRGPVDIWLNVIAQR